MTFIEEYKIDPLVCDELIKYHKNHTEYKTKGAVGADGTINLKEKDSTDVAFFNGSTHPTIMKFFKSLGVCVNDYVKKYFCSPNHRVYTCLDNLIQHYKKGGGFKVLHYERAHVGVAKRQLVYMLYCNTLKNGGTEFPLQDKILQAKKGKLVIWPTDFSHALKGVLSHPEEKYIATGWFELI